MCVIQGVCHVCAERATDGAQATENWGLFMEVCDLISETDDG